ncbi:hypothetical protein [Sinorhizobium medicae]
MADAQKMKKLIEDCEGNIAACLHPESGIPETHLLQQLLSRLDGQQAKEALGDDGQGGLPYSDDADEDDDINPSPTLWTQPEFFGAIWRLKI